MTSSPLSIDLELESFGWPEELTTTTLKVANDLNSLRKENNFASHKSYDSIIDNTMIAFIFLIIYIYCLFELFLEFIFNEININISLPQLSIFNNTHNSFVLSMLRTK